MWNDCQDIVSIHEKKHKARKVCIVHYHFYFSVAHTTDIYKYIYVYICTHTQIYIYIYTHTYTHTQNVSGRIHKKQVSVVASGKKN